MKPRRLPHSIARTLAGISIITALSPIDVHASEGPVLEEVVVTAQKRAVSLQDTALAVTAFSGPDLDRAGMTNVLNLGDVVPNLHVAQEGARVAEHSGRGTRRHSR